MKTKIIFILLCFLSLNVMGQGVITRNKKPKTTQTQPTKTKTKTKTASNAVKPRVSVGKLQNPSNPTDLRITERTISDLLYFPYGILPKSLKTKNELQMALSNTIGSYEVINAFGIGKYRSTSYNYTYRGIAIEISYIIIYESDYEFNCYYHFLFDSQREADKFSSTLCNDVRNAGIPLIPDNIYGGFSNRKKPVSIFRWVAISPAKKIQEKGPIHKAEHVGKYEVEFSVYKYLKKI